MSVFTPAVALFPFYDRIFIEERPWPNNIKVYGNDKLKITTWDVVRRREKFLLFTSILRSFSIMWRFLFICVKSSDISLETTVFENHQKRSHFHFKSGYYCLFLTHKFNINETFFNFQTVCSCQSCIMIDTQLYSAVLVWSQLVVILLCKDK